MKILGYSERGIINALLYEIAGQSDPGDTLHSLLAKAAFPFAGGRRPIRGEVTVLVEQSFSDFGKSDAVILIRGDAEAKCSIFVEAKVKTFAVWQWRICDEFAEFRKQLNQKVPSSNLFTQLYHKVALVNGLRQGGIKQLQQGLQFPLWSSKRLRRIGDNKVVHKATTLLQQHLGEVFYLAIVPDSTQHVKKFFSNNFKTPPHPSLQGTWDVTTFGFLTWEQVKDFCVQNGLTRVVEVFDYNQGQIY